jgi:hypothetical protein
VQPRRATARVQNAVDRNERRRAERIRTPGLRAWISGPLFTPARIVDLGAHGAAVEAPVPLRVRMIVFVRLLLEGRLLAIRRAMVVRTADGVAGISFVD